VVYWPDHEKPQQVTLGDGGTPYVERFADSPAAKAFREIVEHILNGLKGAEG